MNLSIRNLNIIYLVYIDYNILFLYVSVQWFINCRLYIVYVLNSVSMHSTSLRYYLLKNY